MAVVKEFNKEFIEEIDRIREELFALNVKIANDWKRNVSEQNHSTDGSMHVEVFSFINKAIEILMAAKNHIEKEEKSK